MTWGKVLYKMSKHTIRTYFNVRYSSLMLKSPLKIPRVAKFSFKKMRTTFFIFPNIQEINNIVKKAGCNKQYT